MSQPTRKLAAIMFTDIVGFTDLTAADEAIALKLLQWQRETFQSLIAEHGGEWLKEIGDGLLLSFASSQDAVRCAIRIQDAVRCAIRIQDAVGEVPNLKLRIGIHQGDIVQDGTDILGDGVNMASRIEAVAPVGGIAFSEKVQQDIAGYPEFETVSLGEYSLKGASRPVTLHCLAPYGLPNIPEYKLLCRTGAGAYGEVWLAQTLTGIYRAVKVVRRSQFEDERPYEREFKGITEYEPVSRKSDGLIDLLHVGRSEADDFFYYVMELADGQRPSAEINVASYQPKTLQSELESRGRLTVEECLKHGSHLARALAFLHSQNLVHRDIKPANIVFVNGQPNLADIGLVTTKDNASTLVGTMGYIPPEGPGKASSDIYALGMVLYELSTGKDRADFPEVDVLDPALKGLNQVCLKACSNDLSERFSDANALADELDRMSLEPLERSSSASPVGSYKMAALAASLFLILALIYFSRDTKPDLADTPPSKPPSPVAKGKSGSGSGSGKSIKPLGTTDLTGGLVAYYPFNGNAKDESGNGNNGEVKGATPSEDRHGVKNSAYSFDGVNDYIQSNIGQHSTITFSVWFKAPYPTAHYPRILKYGELYKGFQFALDGNHPDHISNGTVGEFYLAKNISSEVTHQIKTTNNSLTDDIWHHAVGVVGKDANMTLYVDGNLIGTENFSADLFDNNGSLLMGWHLPNDGVHSNPSRFYYKGKIDDVRIYNRGLSVVEVTELYELEKPKGQLELHEQLTIKSGANHRWGIGMDEKGERLAVATGRAIKIWNLADGKEIFNYPIKQVTCMAYSPKGKWVAHSHGKVIDLIDPKTGRISFTLPDDGGNHQSLDFNPDGKVLAVSRRDGKTRLWDLVSHKQAGELYALSSDAVRFNRDGHWLAGHSNGQLRVWELPFREHVLFTYDDYTSQIAWSPDSKLIAAALGKGPGIPGNINVWDIPGKKRVLELKGHQNTVSAVAFNPNGKMLASSGEGDGGAQDTSIRFWDLASGRELLKNEAHKSNVFHLAFTPDGKGLISTSIDGLTKVWEIIPKGK